MKENLTFLIEQVKKEAKYDLHNAKLLFIEGIEKTMPKFGEPLDTVDFKKYFENKISAEFGEVYADIIQFYKELIKDNLNYTFGEMIEISKDEFLEKLEEIEDRLQKVD